MVKFKSLPITECTISAGVPRTLYKIPHDKVSMTFNGWGRFFPATFLYTGRRAPKFGSIYVIFPSIL